MIGRFKLSTLDIRPLGFNPDIDLDVHLTVWYNRWRIHSYRWLELELDLVGLHPAIRLINNSVQHCGSDQSHLIILLSRLITRFWCRYTNIVPYKTINYTSAIIRQNDVKLRLKGFCAVDARKLLVRPSPFIDKRRVWNNYLRSPDPTFARYLAITCTFRCITVMRKWCRELRDLGITPDLCISEWEGHLKKSAVAN